MRQRDLTMRPLSPTVEDLGMKIVLLAAKCVGTTPPASTRKNVKQEVRYQPTRTSVDSVKDAILSRRGLFLCSNHFIKCTLVNFPLSIFGIFLNVFENGLVGMVPLVLGTWLKNLAPIGQSHARLVLIFKGMTVFIGNGMSICFMGPMHAG